MSNKAVLLSTKPKWCALIASGKKTLEVRKTKPKIETPFKVYIYCTSPSANDPNEILETHSPWGKIYRVNGKIMGEFTCDKIERVNIPSPFYQDELDEHYLEQSCLSYKELHYFCGRKGAYFWHITDLKIYDEPKKLSGFLVPCDESCSDCEYWQYQMVNQHEQDFDCTNSYYPKPLVPLKKAPQSWRYVVEVEE